MYLTKEQEKLLAGEKDSVTQRFMQLIVKLGEIYEAEKLIPVSSVQISGVSYKSIKDPGLSFLEDIAKQAKVKVFSFLNPAGIDLESWQELGFNKEFAEKQKRIIDAFRGMGVITSATCTPYLVGNLPHYGEHIAWSESSAVSFANSVLGARTNRESGMSALAAAITGYTACYGLHLDENRKANILVKVKTKLKCIADFGALGYWVGKKIGNLIPYFKGFLASTDQLKALGAAMAATGAVALYYVEKITPDWKDQDLNGIEILEFGEKELKDVYNSFADEEPDILFTGCPHASLAEIKHIVEKVRGKKLKKQLWIMTSRMIKEMAKKIGWEKILAKANVKIVADTCMVVSPIEELGCKISGVNSGKAAFYMPSFCKQMVVFKSIDELIDKVME